MKHHPTDLTNNLERLVAVYMPAATGRNRVDLIFKDGDLMSLTPRMFYELMKGK